MKLVILGSGTILPHTGRNPAGFALKTQDQWLLFDLGSGNLKNLATKGVYATDLQHIFLSHFHLDHIGDLTNLFFSLHIPGYKRKEPLHFYGPVGLKQLFQSLQECWGSWLQTAGYELILHEVKPGERINLSDSFIDIYEAEHGGSKMNAISFRVEEKTSKKRFVYSGDSDYCAPLIECCWKADLAILECASLDNNKIPGHLTPKLCGQIAKSAGVKRVVLTHLYPECFLPQEQQEAHLFRKDHLQVYPELMRAFQQHADFFPLIGYDLMELEI